MNIEDFFKEWIITRPNLKVEFHEAGIEAMAFADAYHKKQCTITGVVGQSEQLKADEELIINGERYVADYVAKHGKDLTSL